MDFKGKQIAHLINQFYAGSFIGVSYLAQYLKQILQNKKLS